MICAKLESAGIRSFIPDEGTVQVNPIFANALGGIRVQVDECDLDRAREILGSSQPATDAGMSVCPRCASRNLRYERISRRFAFLSLLLLGFPLLWIKHRWICVDCGYKWQRSRDG